MLEPRPMKKTFKIVIPILIVCTLSYLLYNVAVKIEYKNKVEKKLQTIPSFSFKTLENKDFKNVDLIPNVFTIFIYFNTDCDYCQHEAQSISENLASFKDTQFLFVSTENPAAIKEFAKSYHLLDQPNITFLHDNTNTFYARFDANSIPYLLVYNKKQELIKKHKGQLNAEAIRKILIPAHTGSQ